MERLFFGSFPASDNILVTGKDIEEHRRNLQLCLDQCKKKGITLKLSKSSFCLTQVKWFGRIFTGHGVTADIDKIEHIEGVGRPANKEDMRSLLMACQFNAKFSFDNAVGQNYEEITAPLRHFTHFTQIERHTLQQIHQKLEAFTKSGTMERSGSP